MKKTITIEIDEETFNELNNAVAAYNDIVWACFFGCQVSNKFEKLKDLPDEILLARRDSLFNMYKEIEKQFFD